MLDMRTFSAVAALSLLQTTVLASFHNHNHLQHQLQHRSTTGFDYEHFFPECMPTITNADGGLTLDDNTPCAAALVLYQWCQNGRAVDEQQTCICASDFFVYEAE